jgi:predicted RNase H-like HicB family nuclease
MNYNIEYEREEDGRWIAEVPTLPGVMAYGTTADEAMTKAEALALRVLADTPYLVSSRIPGFCICLP